MYGSVCEKSCGDIIIVGLSKDEDIYLEIFYINIMNNNKRSIDIYKILF